MYAIRSYYGPHPGNFTIIPDISGLARMSDNGQANRMLPAAREFAKNGVRVLTVDGDNEWTFYAVGTVAAPDFFAAVAANGDSYNFV